MHPRWTFAALVLTLIAALAAIPAVAYAGGDDDHGPSAHSYEVTVTNLTPGQILTPPVFAAHRGGFDLFSKGQPASVWLKEIAENGNVGPLATSLTQSRGVVASGVASDPDGITADGEGPIVGGASRTWTFEASSSAKYLSSASMVVCTNDGFTGLDGTKLPKGKGKTVEVYVYALDAGTEIDTQVAADLVPPCSGGASGTGVSNPSLFESGVVSNHAGITATGDLDPAVWGWTGPVAKFVITRTA